MIYGLAGASGTGKTTLGRMVAEKLGIEFLPTSITDLARSCGYEAIGKLSLSDRLVLQEKMLAEFITRLKSVKGNVITDRTPLDMVGYMMAEVHMHSAESLNEQEMLRADKYVRYCQMGTWRFFDHTFIVEPLPKYEDAPTRPGWNPAYQRNVHLLINGAAITSPRSIRHTRIITTDLSERVEYISNFLANRIQKIECMKNTSRKLH